MSNNQTQPTIPVKKSDGTIVRMSLEEFKKYQQELNNKKTTGVPPKGGVVQGENLPAIEIPPVLSTTAPVSEVFVDEALAKSKIPKRDVALSGLYVQNPKSKQNPNSKLQEIVNNEINRNRETSQNIDAGQVGNSSVDKETSLLEEPVEEEITQAPKVVFKKDNSAKEIIAKLSFKVAPDLAGRLESLVNSRLRDIRDDVQFIDYAQKAVGNGGVGLREEKAEEILKLISSNFKFQISNKNQRLKKEIGNSEQRTVNSEQNLNSKPANSEQIDRIQDTGYRIQNMGSHPPMNDILPPPKPAAQPVGPVEELRMFTLTDFRHLGEVKKAGEILAQKFITLKNESFFLFRDGLDAWHQSPLFNEYRKVLAQALRENKMVEAVLSEGGGLTREEFDEMVEVGKNFNV